MADERDAKVSQRYRELGSEEPPRVLDQTLLAAAHRAADKPHAPLVTPAGRHRWYFSIGAAAIVVLAVAVTWHVERAQPDQESVLKEEAPRQALKTPSEEALERLPAESRMRQKVPAAAEPAPASPRQDTAGAIARSQPDTRREFGTRDAEMQAAPAAPVPAPEAKPDTPERFLDRIAELRKAGRHDEADKALAEFRNRYPDYRIPREMLDRVERK
jgi:hypothetical protein